MGKKKLETAPASNDAVPSQSQADIFKTLFGDVNESASIFSDENPFKRKPGQQTLEPAPVSTDNGRSEKRKEEGSVPGERASGSVKKPKNEKLRSSNSEDAVELIRDEKKKKKRKRDEVEKEYEAKKYGSVNGGDEEEEKRVADRVGAKRKTVDNPAEILVSKEGFDDESKLLRTVFVGNLPMNVKKKGLIKEFGIFGEVESVRIRSVPITDTKTPRKGAVITKQFHESADSVHGYVVFKTEESAQASLAHNMAVVGGHHIRVDRACPPRKKMKGEEIPLYDHKRTVFVGNLPFDVKDEEVYQLFCGINNMESGVEGVRVIRDPHTNLGKGFAYILFKTSEAAHSVVKKRTLKLRDRDLRLFPAKSDSNPSKRKNPTPAEKSRSPAKKFRHSGPADGNKRVFSNTSTSYQGVRASKSGVQKKVAKGTRPPAKVNSNAQKSAGGRQDKRPSVAARKAKANAMRDIGVQKQAGTKRKMDSRTPDSSFRKKKANKVR